MTIEELLPAKSAKSSKPHSDIFNALLQGPRMKHESKTKKARKMDS